MRRGYTYAIISAILFGSAGIIIKYAFAEGVDSVDLLILQYIMATIIMGISIAVTNRDILKITLKDLRNCAVLGIVGNTFMTVFYYMAFSYLQVPLVAILLYTYPVMVFIYSTIFERAKIDSNKTLGMIMAFIGCFLALGLYKGVGKISIIGIVFGLLSAVFFAFMNIYSGKRLNNLNSYTINFYSTVFSLISLMIYRFPFYILRGEVSVKLIFYTSILAIVCEIIPLTLLYASIQKIGSLRSSIVGNLEIPTAMILSYVFFNEGVAPLQVCGAGMVAYSIYRLK